jgi:hypothetical protein
MEERQIDSDELIEAIAQIKTFENYLITRNIDQLFARKKGKEFSLTPNSQSASMMIHTYQANPVGEEHHEETSGEPSKQKGFPFGTEERNSNENLTTLVPGRKPCSEYNSSPTKSVLTNMSPESQAAETITQFKKSQNKPNWLHHMRDRLQWGLCDQMFGPKSELEAHMNDQGHLRGPNIELNEPTSLPPVVWKQRRSVKVTQWWWLKKLQRDNVI